MARSRRPTAPYALLLLACALGAVPAVAAEGPWRTPFADPAAIAAAAATVEPTSPDAGALVLLDETEVRFESDGRRTVRLRLVARITAASAISSWGEVAYEWAPWYQERPELRARVIGPDGSEHWLDPATLSEQPVASLDETIYTDLRRLTAPLPALAVGAVTEEEWVLRETAPFFPAGIAGRHLFTRGVPAARQRLVLDVPADMPFAFDTELVAVEPLREEADGRVRWTWELIDQPAPETWVLDTPGEVITIPAVEYASGRSWSEVGAAYARWVDERVSGFVPPKPLAKALAGGERRERIAAALAWLHEEVRYTALELGEAAIVPAAPSEVLARKYGDCKDKATLLVAALRHAGIEAEVALLVTGPGFDVDPDLPGLGLFDHVIVHLPGEPELWIDATAEHARLGNLPEVDRGRLALIARAEGAELRRTPDSTAAENFVRRELDVRLGDWGDGELHETVVATGDFELAVRQVLDAVPPDDPAAQAELVEPPATDVSQPLVVRFPVQPSGTHTEEGWATVLADTSFVFTKLHETLPLAGEERRFDLAMTPFTAELQIDVVPPRGFLPFDPPAAEERPLGAMQLSRRVTSDEDGRLHLVLRLESPRARLTPDEVAATREALDAAIAEGPIELRFQSRGQALLDAGQVVEAVAELRRQTVSGGAADRVRLAYALLKAGMGEAARREARAAVAAEPDAAFAHQALGYVLLHDVLGRQFQPGSDLAGAETALRRARELDADDELAARNLAVLLEHASHGVEPSAERRDEAIALYRTLRDDLAITAHDGNLLLALWQAGRHQEVAELAAEQTVPTSGVFALAALAAERGAAAAVRESGRGVDADSRRQTLDVVANLLLVVRDYPAAAEVLRATAQGAPDAAARLARAAVVGQIVPFESLSLDAADPRRVVLDTVRAFMLLDETAIAALATAAEPYGGLAEGFVEIGRAVHQPIRRLVEQQGGSVLSMLDSIASSVEMQVDGSPAEGYRVSITAPASRRETWYLAAGDERPVVLTEGSLSFASFGRQAMRRLEAGDLEGARRWLDWAREEAPAGNLDDPWSSHPITAFWSRGEVGDEAACRRAAGVLLAGGSDAAALVDALEAGLAGAGSEAHRRGYEEALVAAYTELERWDDLAALARARLAASPEAGSALGILSLALMKAGRLDELTAFAEERLERRPDDAEALRMAAAAARARGDLAGAVELLERVVATPGSGAADFNSLAWSRLLAGDIDEGTLEEAHRAVQGGLAVAGYGELHTLASVLAELDRPLEARNVLVEALEILASPEPKSSDWYVLGRIAESFGETEIAVASYRRVEEPEDPLALPLSTWKLAQRRLAAIAAAERKAPQAAARR